MRPRFLNFLLRHCGLVDAARLFFEARRPQIESEEDLPFSFRGHNGDLTMKLRRGTTDLNVFFEIFYAEVYRLPLETSPAVILDLGANIGMASMYFAMLYPNARVCAFEPVSSNFDRLQWHVKMNALARVEVFPLGVGNYTGPAELRSPSAKRCGDFSSDEEAVGEGVAVRMLDAENLLTTLAIEKVDLLKIDIEGAEHAVFRRLGNDLRRISNIVGEMHGNEEIVQATLDLLSASHAVSHGPRLPGKCFHFKAILKS